VVCDGSGRSGGEDLGSSVWRAKIVSHRTHLDHSRVGRVGPPPISVFVCGRQGQLYEASGGSSLQMVKCWDLEVNKVIRHYHGHFSGVYSLSVHPTLDVLVTAGRDASVRVWDMRTRANVFTLTGHTSTVADVKTQASDPQIISGSMDSTIR
jgi:WD40 repeat protein